MTPPRGSGTIFGGGISFFTGVGSMLTPERTPPYPCADPEPRPNGAHTAQNGARCLQTGQNIGRKWPQSAPLTLSNGRGALLKISPFDRFWAHLAPRLVGNPTPSPRPYPWRTDPKRAQPAHKRRPGGSHGPQAAVFRHPVAPGRMARGWIPLARDQGG